MNHIVNAFKNLPRRGQHNFVKILCLSLGLAISSVIIAEIYFEQTYDTYFDGWERTYQISEVGYKSGKSFIRQDQTSGAIAHGVKQYAPMIEAATRTDWMGNSDYQCKLDDQRVLSATILLADSCFFDVFPQKILQGDAKEVLSRPRYCLVNTDIAKKIGGNVVGNRFTVPNCPGVTFTIGGVFEDFPWGASYHQAQVIMSMPTTPDVSSYDGRGDWMGNETYRSYVRLAKGHKPEELKPYVDKMRKDHLPMEEFKKNGWDIQYDFTVLSDIYTQNSYIKMMGWIMGIIAFVLLFTSVMNYLLIIVGNLVTRSREMAVRKCYGAEPKDIHAIIFSEALVHVGLSVVLAAILVFLCKGTIQDFLSAPVATLVFNRGSWILVVICILVLFVGGVVPGWLYNKIPVAIAFRGYTENRNRWKLALLGIQFVISGLLFSLLYVVNSQYLMMVSMNPGYDYDNLAIVKVDALDRNQRTQCLSEIKRLPDVQMVSSAYSIPLQGYPLTGNTMSVSKDGRDAFNYMDMGGVGDGFFEMMGIPLVQGSFFTERSDSSKEVIIDEKMAKKVAKLGHWKDGVIGKRLHLYGYEKEYVVCGVFRNIQMMGVSTIDAEAKSFPVAYTYAAKAAPFMLVKFKDSSEEALSQLYDKVHSMYPNNRVTVVDYASEFKAQYGAQLHFRNGILVGGIITMVIALFGLVGYTSDEVNRRRKEIAIRKVNGAKVSDILRIFLKDITKIALPCIVIGDVVAWAIARQWLMSFSVKTSLTPLEFIYVTIALLLIIGTAVVINCYKVANSNPVKYLKDE